MNKKKTGLIAVLLVLLAASPLAARALDDELSADRMLKCRKLMPEPLRDLMQRREQILRRGFAGTSFAGNETAIRTALLTEMDVMRRLLADGRSLEDIIFQFGRLARLACDYTDWAVYATGADDAHRLADFNAFIRRKQSRFIAVFYDYSPRLFEAHDLAAYLDDMARYSSSLTGQVVSLYRQGGHAAVFDDRSPAFGLAARHYSHTITHMANIWLYCWREGHGDMTGVPFYPYPLPHASKRIKGESHD
ncbi:MAG: hypothetical protein JXQ27_02895 [Acidobacteria bacterium]|nr:hypothetical protein [Acidobacteriota bacterium]